MQLDNVYTLWVVTDFQSFWISTARVLSMKVQLQAAADVMVLFFFFWLVQGWLAEVEERMPSKSDTHRRSGLYETQNSTTVGNNCAQDRERYGMLWTTTHTSTAKDNTHVHGIFTVCVLAFEQPGRQLHRGAEFRDSGQSHRQSHIHHARLRRRVWWRRLPAHYRNLQSLVPIWRFNVFNVSPPHPSWSLTLFFFFFFWEYIV